MKNLVPGQYRSVSVATVDGPLTPPALTAHFRGREVYRHTRFVVVRDRAGSVALVRVERAPGDGLFAPVTDVDVLALPHETAYVVDAETDTGVPSALAAAARASAPDARCVVVEGRYAHVSFIVEPDPVRIRVADVVPPRPAKLVDQAARVLAVAEDLPPIELAPEVVDLVDLARRRPSPHYLLPCRGSGFHADGAATSFLDERPGRQDWTLIGCARSRAIHQWFYGDLPDVVDACPLSLLPAGDGPLLTKCCLLERANRVEGSTVTVPWGASLALVKEALVVLSSVADPAWAPA
ncbi:MAG: DUF7714 family protein [Acidimicrobiales bacterium]